MKRAPALPPSRFRAARVALLFWCLFIGIGAVFGAAWMLIAPDGHLLQMQNMLPFFQVLPFAKYLFQDYVFSGIALLCVNGIPNLIAAGLLLAKKRSGVVCGGLFGVTLMLWICIQFVIFPMNVLSTSYFFFGLAQAATGYAAWVFDKQESFAVDPAAYPRVGTNKNELVVYFSRLGYTKKLAYETAEASGAKVCEVLADTLTAGTLGFWWCGRFGMNKWDMPIKPFTEDVSAYEKVTICSPIWVFGLSAPMRAFCRAANGKIKRADYVLVHFQKADYVNAAREMDALLGITRESVRSVCCRHGKRIQDHRL